MRNLTRAAFEREMKLDKLDTLLLFLSSSLSLGVTIFAALQDLRWLMYFLPVLVPAWIMPIYVGYIRGALILGSLKERVRGWTYFVSGIGTYAALYIISFVSDPILRIVSTSERNVLSFFGSFVLIATIFISIFFVPHKILEMFRENVTRNMRKAIGYTVLSSYTAGTLFYLIPRGYSAIFEGPVKLGIEAEIMATIFWVLAGCLIFFLFQYCERKARRLVETSRN